MNEAELALVMEVEAHGNAAEILKPGEQSLDLPPSFVPAQDSAVLRPGLLPVRLVRGDHLSAALREGMLPLVADAFHHSFNLIAYQATLMEYRVSTGLPALVKQRTLATKLAPAELQFV